MEQLKPNQILLEISEDKKKVTVSCGAFYNPLTFDTCPAKTSHNVTIKISRWYDDGSALLEHGRVADYLSEYVKGDSSYLICFFGSR